MDQLNFMNAWILHMLHRNSQELRKINDRLFVAQSTKKQSAMHTETCKYALCACVPMHMRTCTHTDTHANTRAPLMHHVCTHAHSNTHSTHARTNLTQAREGKCVARGACAFPNKRVAVASMTDSFQRKEARVVGRVGIDPERIEGSRGHTTGHLVVNGGRLKRGYGAGIFLRPGRGRVREGGSRDPPLGGG